MEAETGHFRCRVVLIGDASVGKTSILGRLVDHKFDPDQPSTVGANYQIFVRDVDNIKVELQIWDTAGQEKFRSLGPIYYRDALGAVVVYDVTQRRTFTNIETWIQQFQQAATCAPTVVVVGNKTDMVEDRKIPTAEGEVFAQSRAFLFTEISAKTGEGVKPLFDTLTRAIVTARTSTAPRHRELSPAAASGCMC
jgi:small GTP-binding protein